MKFELRIKEEIKKLGIGILFIGIGIILVLFMIAWLLYKILFFLKVRHQLL